MMAAMEGHRQAYVREEAPTPVPDPDRGRWFCFGASGRRWFDDVDAAVAFASARADGVVVRTLSKLVFRVGPPAGGPDVDVDFDAEPWPPTDRQWSVIEDAYREMAKAVRNWTDCRRRYEAARDASLRERGPAAASFPRDRNWWLREPGRRSPELFLEPLSADGTFWGVHRGGTAEMAFGGRTEAIAAVSGRPGDDPWIAAVSAAVERETSPGWRPRWELDVDLGRGEMFHASASANRASIREHGLDWRRMGQATGVAGSPAPEMPCVFLDRTLQGVQFFVGAAVSPVDVWAVDVDGLWVENGPDGWWLVAQPIPPERVRLVAADLDAPSRSPSRS